MYEVYFFYNVGHEKVSYIHKWFCFFHHILLFVQELYNSSCLSVSPPSLHVHYRHFNATTGQSATEADFGTFLPCSSLSAFPLAFRLLLPTFHQRACITVLPPLWRMPQCHRQVIEETFSHLIGSYGYILYGR